MSLTSRQSGTSFLKPNTVADKSTLTQHELAELWVRAGGNPAVAETASAIAMAESGGQVHAHNPSGASGLWQILGQVVAGNIYDPMVNAKNAVKKYNDANGWTPWETYTNGNYQSYLGKGGAGIPLGSPGTVKKYSGIPGVEQVEQGITDVQSAGDFLTKMAETLLDFKKLGQLAAEAFAWFLRKVVEAIYDYVIAPLLHWGERAVSWYWVNFFGTGTEQGSGLGFQLRQNAGIITISFWAIGYAVLWTDGSSASPVPTQESMMGQSVRGAIGLAARRKLIKPSQVDEKTPNKPTPAKSTIQIQKATEFSVSRKRPVNVSQGGLSVNVDNRGERPISRSAKQTEGKIILPAGVVPRPPKKQKADTQNPSQSGGAGVGTRDNSGSGTEDSPVTSSATGNKA